MGNTGTKENTSGIMRSQTYQNVITATNPVTSRKTAGRESGKKSQKATKTNIIGRNAIIAKLKITKERIAT